MKKSRSLDHDGLDGIIPSTDQARLKSVNPPGKLDKTLKKPMHRNVPWLLGVIGLLAVVAVLVPDLTKKPETAIQNAALDTPATPAPSPGSEPVLATGDTDTPAANPSTKATPNLVAEAKPDRVITVSENPQPSAVSDAHTPSTDVLPELPSEPTGAGIPKAVGENPAQPSVTAPFIVYFKFDSSKLTAESTNSANELVSAAKRCQNQIKLIGHTCNLGSDDANLQLGLTRANAVKKLLIANGIGAKVVLTASEGMRKPAAANDSKQGQALNRRVELQCVDN